MPCGKESSPRIAIGRKLLTEEPSCEAEDMTAPETFTAASKRPLTTGRRPDMTAIRGYCRKARISAAITIPKTAGSLDGNFLRGSAERSIFRRTTLS